MSLRTMATFQHWSGDGSPLRVSPCWLSALARWRLEVDEVRALALARRSADGFLGRDSRSITTRLSSTDPARSTRSPGRRGSLGKRPSSASWGVSCSSLGIGVLRTNTVLVEPMRHVDATHRKLVLGRVGLHEHQALLAVVHQGIGGDLDYADAAVGSPRWPWHMPCPDSLSRVVDIPFDDRRVLIGVDDVSRSRRWFPQVRRPNRRRPLPRSTVCRSDRRASRVGQLILGAVGYDQKLAHVGDLKQVDRVVHDHLAFVDVVLDDDAVDRRAQGHSAPWVVILDAGTTLPPFACFSRVTHRPSGVLSQASLLPQIFLASA